MPLIKNVFWPSFQVGLHGGDVKRGIPLPWRCTGYCAAQGYARHHCSGMDILFIESPYHHILLFMYCSLVLSIVFWCSDWMLSALFLTFLSLYIPLLIPITPYCIMYISASKDFIVSKTVVNKLFLINQSGSILLPHTPLFLQIISSVAFVNLSRVFCFPGVEDPGRDYGDSEPLQHSDGS